MTRLVAVAHFPPPVHGMAVAVQSLLRELERTVTVRRVNIAAPALHRGSGYHLTRTARVARAVAVLAVERPRTRQAFFSCDAGAGMLYTLVLVAAARLLGYRCLLQHHSYAYLLRRSAVLAAVVRLGGARVVHLVTAPVMQADFLARYPGSVTRVVGIARDLPVVSSPASFSGDRLVLGFLGNVSVEKGIGLALDTVRAAWAAGLPVSLRVAGPVDPAAAALLGDAGPAAGERPGEIEWSSCRTGAAEPPPGVTGSDEPEVSVVGPVYGPDRDAFLDGVDVLLFPSRYPHESFGLAAWEAMARGRPVLAHRSGCLTAEAIGGGGLVVERDDDFTTRAVALLGAWSAEPRLLARSARLAHAAAASVVHTSREQVEHLAADLHDPITSPNAPGRRRTTMTLAILLAGLLPASRAKNRLLRLLGGRGWSIDPTARIQPVLLWRVHRLRLRAGAFVGPGCVFRDMALVYLGDQAEIGQFNWFSGAAAGADGVAVEDETLRASLVLSAHAGVTSRHYLDCSGGVHLQHAAVLAGVRSTVLSHSIDPHTMTQHARPVRIGRSSVVMTNSVINAGVTVASDCLVAAGAVITGDLTLSGHFYGGVPAKRIADVSDAACFGRHTSRATPRVNLFAGPRRAS